MTTTTQQPTVLGFLCIVDGKPRGYSAQRQSPDDLPLMAVNEHYQRLTLGQHRAALTALPVAQAGQSGQAPEGWKLVPVEPTEDLLEAIHNGGYVGDDQELRQFYQSILDAVPSPGGE